MMGEEPMPLHLRGPSHVLDYLSLGDRLHGNCERLIREEGITHVLNVHHSCRFPSPSATWKFRHVPISDYGESELFSQHSKLLRKCFDFISAAKASNGVVLVHCQRGINRSPTVVIAWLMVHEGWSLERAYLHVKERRTMMSPHERYFAQLQRLEQEVHGRISLTREQIGPSLQQMMRDLRALYLEEQAREAAGGGNRSRADSATENDSNRSHTSVSARGRLNSETETDANNRSRSGLGSNRARLNSGTDDTIAEGMVAVGATGRARMGSGSSRRTSDLFDNVSRPRVNSGSHKRNNSDPDDIIFPRTRVGSGTQTRGTFEEGVHVLNSINRKSITEEAKPSGGVNTGGRPGRVNSRTEGASRPRLDSGSRNGVPDSSDKIAPTGVIRPRVNSRGANSPIEPGRRVSNRDAEGNNISFDSKTKHNSPFNNTNVDTATALENLAKAVSNHSPLNDDSNSVKKNRVCAEIEVKDDYFSDKVLPGPPPLPPPPPLHLRPNISLVANAVTDTQGLTVHLSP